MNFRTGVAEGLIKVEQPAPKKGRPLSNRPISEDENSPPSKRAKYQKKPTEYVVEDIIVYMPVFSDTTYAMRCKQKGCKSKTFFMCEKCQVNLCISRDNNCLKDSHVGTQE